MKDQVENLACSSGLDLLPLKNSSCSANDHLWDDIELAERYLVCAMFEEAHVLASSLLCKLCRKASGNDLSSSHQIHHDFLHSRDFSMEVNLERPAEEADMIEAAGMVLIQAYSQIGRSNEIFEVLKPFFGCIVDVPSSLLLVGVCLQISMGSFLIAHGVLESYLQGWKHRTAEEAYTTIWFMKARNMDIAEVYAVQVLGKCLRSPELALQWVFDTNIPIERRQDMIEKLQRFLVHGVNSNEKVNNLVNQFEDNTKVVISSGKEFVSKAEESQQKIEMKMKNLETSFRQNATEEVVTGNLSRSHLFNVVLLYLSKLFGASSIGLLLCSRKAQKLQSICIQKRKIVGGMASLILLFVLYKQRRTARRVLWGFFYDIRVGLVDLWQLAFNVQLNPLAAVQPLSSAPSISR